MEHLQLPCCTAPRFMIRRTGGLGMDTTAQNYAYLSCSTCDTFIRFVDYAASGLEFHPYDPVDLHSISEQPANTSSPMIQEPYFLPSSENQNASASLTGAASVQQHEIGHVSETALQQPKIHHAEPSQQPSFARASHPHTTSLPHFQIDQGSSSKRARLEHGVSQPSTGHVPSNVSPFVSSQVNQPSAFAANNTYDSVFGNRINTQSGVNAPVICSCGIPVKLRAVPSSSMGKAKAWVCSDGSCGFFILSRDEQSEINVQSGFMEM